MLQATWLHATLAFAAEARSLDEDEQHEGGQSCAHDDPLLLVGLELDPLAKDVVYKCCKEVGEEKEINDSMLATKKMRHLLSIEVNRLSLSLLMTK